MDFNALIDKAARVKDMRAELLSLDGERATLIKEISALENEIKGAMGGVGVTMIADHRDQIARASAGIGPEWKPIMARLCTLNQFGYPELMKTAEVFGRKIKIGTARVKMANWKANGLIDAKEPGKFTVTKKARTLVGIE